MASEIGRVTAVTLAVLRALAAPPDQRHGYAIAQNARCKLGSVYPVLDRLTEAGWITAHWEDSPYPGRPRRRVYSFTGRGESGAAQVLAERARPEPKPAGQLGRRRLPRVSPAGSEPGA